MNASEINKYLSNSAYVGLFDLIGLIITDGTLNPNKHDMFKENSLAIDLCIYRGSFRIFTDKEDLACRFINTNFKVKGEYYDLNYTITRKKYTGVSEAREPFRFLFADDWDNIKPEILGIFNRLFGRVEVTYSLEKGRTFIIDTSTSEDLSEYKITKHEDYLNNGRLIFTSPSPGKLLDNLLDSPFMDYIRCYKINYQTVL
jgi:hypothetical protein